MTSPTGPERRVEIARIIDPEAWDEISADDNEEVAAIFADAWEDALAKADAVMALPDPMGEELAGNDELIVFLEEAAKYFERRPTHGEDVAFWANVYNAKNCRKAAALLRGDGGGGRGAAQSLPDRVENDTHTQHDDGEG